MNTVLAGHHHPLSTWLPLQDLPMPFGSQGGNTHIAKTGDATLHKVCHDCL